MLIGRLTLSDRVSAGAYQDLSGPEIECLFREYWNENESSDGIKFPSRVISDEGALIADTLRNLADEQRCPGIITTGGTFGPYQTFQIQRVRRRTFSAGRRRTLRLPTDLKSLTSEKCMI